MTRTPLSRLKDHRSRSPRRSAHRHVGASSVCSGGRGNVLAVGKLLLRCRLLGSARRFGTHGGGEGRGISWRPPAYSLLIKTIKRLQICNEHRFWGRFLRFAGLPAVGVAGRSVPLGLYFRFSASDVGRSCLTPSPTMFGSSFATVVVDTAQHRRRARRQHVRQMSPQPHQVGVGLSTS